MSLEIVPFHEQLLPRAAELLARRHRRDRLVMPLLPARFEDTRNALAAAREVWHKPNASGVAALRDGEMLGYLMGEPRFDTLRGRHVWIHLPGHALAEGIDGALAADLNGRLYAAAGPDWLAQGAFDHYIILPAGDAAALEAWFTLSFGKEQAHAMRSLEEPLPVASDVPGVRVRLATAADRNALVEQMSPILRRHMVGPPVWGAALPEHTAEVREGFGEMLDDDSVRVWLAEAGAAQGEEPRLLGYQAFFAASPSDDNLTIPLSDRAVILEVAATMPDARGRGIGRALTRAGLAQAAADGYRICVADWRTTNIEANRFWPQMGFRPAIYRLTRKVDPRITWATG